MAERDTSRVLLEAALRDLRALRAMGNPTTFADKVFGFHAQQAAEKLLKAWLDHFGHQYPLTHSLALQRLERLLACVRQALSQPSAPAAPD